MINREKVFDALRNCVTEPKCKDCPWEDCEKIGHKRVNVPVTLLLDTLNLLKEQPQWISVKKKLPEQAGYSCLVSAEYGDGKRAEFIAFTGYGESEWYTYDALFMEKEREADNRVHHNYHITHWMPLPEPPEVMQDDRT